MSESEIRRDAAATNETGHAPADAIAIIGMSCLFPSAPDVGAYWQNILRKVDATGDPPPEAWDLDVYYDPEFADTDKVYCKRGGYLGGLLTFDPLQHGIPPISVGGEPDQWLALQLARDAMADAGCTEIPEETRRRTEVILGKGTYLNGGNAIAVERGLIVGQTLEIIKRLRPDYTDAQIDLLRTEMKAALPPMGPETVPGLIPNIIVGRIANRLDLMGAAYTVDAACASSLVAVQHAVRDLQGGICDLVIAGGSQVWMPVPALNVFCQLGALSRSQQIRPFDKDADGTLLGEGIGMIVLKRLSDAERDGNRIYAVIRGGGVASDGRGMSVMAPRIDGEELALSRAYESSGISPRTVGLIEAHGTATPVGDVVEMQALTHVFGPREAELPWCAIGTVKSMISHTIPAAGVAGMIKTALALYHKVLPPTLNCSEPNPKLELATSPFYINTETRPWIHGGSEPRRAGVNAFGFGGINAHVILEEYRERAPIQLPSSGGGDRAHHRNLHYLPEWDSEVFIVSADSRLDLIRRAKELETAVRKLTEQHEATPVRLQDAAYTLNCSEAMLSGSAHLTVIATSFKELGDKLRRAVERLSDPDCAQIKDRSGTYFFTEPLGKVGKIAVMLPGEGAQYPNMLADLCLHFPEARAWFDLTDRVFYEHPRGYRLSDCVFPRPAFSEEERRWADSRLMHMDMAIEAVLTANRAIVTILDRLGLRPDMYVGHSTGEYSALLAAGILDLDDEERLTSFSWAQNRIYSEIATQDGVPRAMMLALGTDREQAQRIAREAGGKIFLAMDNCPHQAVLVGEKEPAERALEIVRREGLIYEQLLFDRAYHTELFSAYGEHVRDVLADLPMRTAHTPAYSCTTASPYPSDPESIRDLVVEHWSSPVRFRETVEALYTEGVRVFVEAGPRGNLTAFVEDILRNKPFCAVPANVQRRSGTDQLNHLVGILMAQGVLLDLSYLYEGRNSHRVEWPGAPSSSLTVPGPRMELSTGWPMLKLSADAVDRVQALGSPGMGEFRPGLSELPPAGKQTAPAPSESPSGHIEIPAIQPYSRLHMPSDQGGGADHRDVPQEPLDNSVQSEDVSQVMGAYFDTMDDFLTVMQQVVQSYPGVGGAAGAAPLETLLSTPGSIDGVTPYTFSRSNPIVPRTTAFPLLGSVVVDESGNELMARRCFDVDEDLYLRDHTFGRHISMTDPELLGLAVMPLTMSLEILAEAAACLVPGSMVLGLRDVRAHHWLAWDEGKQVLEVSARRLPTTSGPERVFVEIRNSTDVSSGVQGPPAVEGTVLLGDSFAPAPSRLTMHLGSGRASLWQSDELYSEVMFHGPAWQGVASIEETADNGAIATLRILPVDTFLRHDAHPKFLLDPALLDAAGQIIGFWTAEHLPTGKIVFPFRLAALDVYHDLLPVGERVTGVAAIQLEGEHQVRSDMDLVGADGRLWMRLVGWEDKRFNLPAAFMPLLSSTNQSRLSTDWPEPVVPFVGQLRVRCRHMATALPSDGPFWKSIWAHRILSRSERAQFQRLRTPEHRQLEWLAGRTAVKEAVLELIHNAYGLDLLPADIEIDPDEAGRPIVGGAWLRVIDRVPVVSLSHSGGHAVAVAALQADGTPKIGIDVETTRTRPSAFSEAAFTHEELVLVKDVDLNERDHCLLYMWCAKEAVAKALGHGMMDGPESVVVVAIDVHRGTVAVKLNRQLAALHADIASNELDVRVGRYGELMFAVTKCEAAPVRSR